MKVILKETIDSLGIIGSEVRVADGYARNYLLPQNKAVPATPQNRKMLERDRTKFDLQIAKEGAAGGVCGGEGVAAGLRASVQSQEVHAASVVCLPGPQGASEDRLSRRDGIS